jgi:hypothetical protein
MNVKLKILKQYVKLRTSLEKERAELQSRLGELEAVLGTVAPEPATAPQLVSTAEAPIRRGPGRPKGSKRKLSPANKAKLIAGVKARWARYRAAKGLKAPEAAKKGPGRPKGKKAGLSAAGRAAIIAAQKLRWAKVKAEKAGKK